MMILRRAALALTCVASTLHVSTAAAQSSGQLCNANGYVFEFNDAVHQGKPLYLGKSCDVFRAADGRSGRWCWANAGVVMEFNDGTRHAIRGLELPSCAPIDAEVPPCEC